MSSRQSAENVPLQQQFEDPLQLIGPLEVDSESKAMSKLEEITKNLDSKDDWNIRSNAILDAMSLLKGGVQKFGIDFSQISTGIANCVSDLRSTLVRNGSLFIAACAQELKNAYITSTDVVIPALSKQLTHGTAIISDSCHLAIIQIAKHVQHRKVVRAMQTLANAKSAINRQVAAEAFQIIVTNWPGKVLAKNLPDIKASLAKLATDPAQSTRKIAKHAQQDMINGGSNDAQLNINIKSTSAPLSYQPSPMKPKTSMAPKRGEETETSGPKSTRTPTTLRKRKPVLKAPASTKATAEERYSQSRAAKRPSIDPPSPPQVSEASIRKTPRKPFIPSLQPSTEVDVMRNSMQKPIGELSDYMPPQSMATTRQFINILTMLIDEGRYDEISGLEMLLPQSIISGTFYVSSISEWKKVLKILYRKYKIDFKEDAKDMIIAFTFDKWIIGLSISAFGEEYVLSLFTDDPNSPDSYNFFVQYLSLYPDRELSDATTQFLSALVKAQKDMNDVSMLEEVIFKQPIEEKLVNQIFDAITNGVDFEELLARLISKGLKTNDQVQNVNNMLNDMLPQLFDTKEPQQINATMDLIISLLSENSTLCLDSILDQILTLACSTSKGIHDKAVACLTALSINQEFLLNMVEHIMELNADQQEVLVSLQMIIECFNDMDSDTLLLFIDVVTPALDMLLKSDITAHRRSAITIATIFESRVHDAFEPFFNSLSPTNQKLIQLKISKGENRFHI